MTLFSLLNFWSPLIPALFLFGPPFLEPEKKMTHWFAHPPTPMNTPLPRCENRLLLLGRVKPSNPPPRGNLSIFEEKQAANLQVQCTFTQRLFSSTLVA